MFSAARLYDEHALREDYVEAAEKFSRAFLTWREADSDEIPEELAEAEEALMRHSQETPDVYFLAKLERLSTADPGQRFVVLRGQKMDERLGISEEPRRHAILDGFRITESRMHASSGWSRRFRHIYNSTTHVPENTTFDYYRVSPNAHLPEEKTAFLDDDDDYIEALASDAISSRSYPSVELDDDDERLIYFTTDLPIYVLEKKRPDQQGVSIKREKPENPEYATPESEHKKRRPIS